MKTRKQIHDLAVHHQGDWTAIAKGIKNHETVPAYPEREAYVTILDPEYPEAFRRLRFPPWILFYRGDLHLAGLPCIGMIGGRSCSEAAMHNAWLAAQELGACYVVVSGLAKGVDGVCHQAAQKTIGVVGCGLDRYYPKENRALQERMEREQLVLSEYPDGTPPLRHHFPWRNRLIAALSERLVVVECSVKSGTMHTVAECLELGVPVHAMPAPFGLPGIQGTNRLIEDGAEILFDQEGLQALMQGKDLLSGKKPDKSNHVGP